MERYRIAVGREHGVKPGNIVGAIANEAGLDARYIGPIDIQDDFSLVDLPAGMPSEVFADLQKTRVCGRPFRLSRLEGAGRAAPKKAGKSGRGAAGKRRRTPS